MSRKFLEFPFNFTLYPYKPLDLPSYYSSVTCNGTLLLRSIHIAGSDVSERIPRYTARCDFLRGNKLVTFRKTNAVRSLARTKIFISGDNCLETMERKILIFFILTNNRFLQRLERGIKNYVNLIRILRPHIFLKKSN